MLGFLINKQSGILSKLTPHSLLAAVEAVGFWQPGIKQCLQQEKERKRVCVRPKMPSVNHHGAKGFPVSRRAFLLRAVGSGSDTDREFLLLNVTGGW